jgi:hypothetical protein
MAAHTGRSDPLLDWTLWKELSARPRDHSPSNNGASVRTSMGDNSSPQFGPDHTDPADTRPPSWVSSRPLMERLLDHSLTIFLLLTGIGWVAMYVKLDSEGKWGQIVGNIVSEWTQIFGLVLLTKESNPMRG